MIIKCAEAVALRKAFSVSGVMGEGEEDRVAERTATASVTVEGDGVPENLNEEIVVKLRAAFEKQRELEIDPWRPAKVRALLATVDNDAATAIADTLEMESEALVLREAEIVDAEPV